MNLKDKHRTIFFLSFLEITKTMYHNRSYGTSSLFHPWVSTFPGIINKDSKKQLYMFHITLVWIDPYKFETISCDLNIWAYTHCKFVWIGTNHLLNIVSEDQLTTKVCLPQVLYRACAPHLCDPCDSTKKNLPKNEEVFSE